MRSSRDATADRERATYRRTHAVRLPEYDYAGPGRIHLVICADRGTPFSERKLAGEICEAIGHACRIHSYELYGYCLMPDHLHVLLSPADSLVPVKDWLQSFKGYTTNRYMRSGGEPPLWQRSAFDRVCRSEETAEKMLMYIVSNPIRAGLTERWEEWPGTRVFIAL